MHRVKIATRRIRAENVFPGRSFPIDGVISFAVIMAAASVGRYSIGYS